MASNGSIRDALSLRSRRRASAALAPRLSLRSRAGAQALPSPAAELCEAAGAQALPSPARAELAKPQAPGAALARTAGLRSRRLGEVDLRHVLRVANRVRAGGAASPVLESHHIRARVEREAFIRTQGFRSVGTLHRRWRECAAAILILFTSPPLCGRDGTGAVHAWLRA